MEEKILHGLYQRCLHQFRLGNTARDTLQEFIDIDVTVDDLVRILQENPAYLQILEKFISIKAPGALAEPKDAQASGEAKPETKQDKGEEKPKEAPKKLSSTYRMMALLGLIGTRNFILAMRIFKNATGQFPQEVKGKWNFSPSEHLAKSQQLEEVCQLHKIQYTETAFAAAYLYDWLFALAKQSPQVRPLSAHLESCWKTGLRTGYVSYAIASRYPNFAYLKYALAAGILSNIGQALMGLLFADTQPTYHDWLVKMDKIPNLSRFAYTLQEESVFQLRYPEVSSLALRNTEIFAGIERAVHYHLEPYYLKPIDKNLYLLAATLQLASHMGKAWRIPPDDKDPLMLQWRRPWVKDLRMNEKKLGEVMKWAMGLGA